MHMDLILWRHAEAEELDPSDDFEDADLSRRLTAKGERQATRMAKWLERQLPDGVKIFSSPAVRTEQTVMALGRKYKVHDELRPSANPEALLELAQWPVGKQAVLVVGHQPTLGQVISRLAGLSESHCAVRKGSVWWLRQRERHGQMQTVIWTVQTPDLL
jgi:phosphohistidine phosphatase